MPTGFVRRRKRPTPPFLDLDGIFRASRERCCADWLCGYHEGMQDGFNLVAETLERMGFENINPPQSDEQEVR